MTRLRDKAREQGKEVEDAKSALAEAVKARDEAQSLAVTGGDASLSSSSSGSLPPRQLQLARKRLLDVQRRASEAEERASEAAKELAECRSREGALRASLRRLEKANEGLLALCAEQKDELAVVDAEASSLRQRAAALLQRQRGSVSSAGIQEAENDDEEDEHDLLGEEIGEGEGEGGDGWAGAGKSHGGSLSASPVDSDGDIDAGAGGFGAFQ